MTILWAFSAAVSCRTILGAATRVSLELQRPTKKVEKKLRPKEKKVEKKLTRLLFLLLQDLRLHDLRLRDLRLQLRRARKSPPPKLLGLMRQRQTHKHLARRCHHWQRHEPDVKSSMVSARRVSTTGKASCVLDLRALAPSLSAARQTLTAPTSTVLAGQANS
jgi:hypothetical protein